MSSTGKKCIIIEKAGFSKSRFLAQTSLIFVTCVHVRKRHKNEKKKIVLKLLFKVITINRESKYMHVAKCRLYIYNSNLYVKKLKTMYNLFSSLFLRQFHSHWEYTAWVGLYSTHENSSWSQLDPKWKKINPYKVGAPDAKV